MDNKNGVTKDVYLKAVIREMPRLLGNLCRVPSMKTYGCFDRDYWNYAAYGTPLTRKQEGALTLSLAYLIEHPYNPYYKKDILVEWIKAGIDFWSSLQLKTGAFNDLYPNEHAHVSTSFTSYAVSESMLLLKDICEVEDKHLAALRKAAKWLEKKFDKEVLNHDAGATIFFYNLYLLTGDGKYKNLALERTYYIGRQQDREGWFPEYGGPDIGYLSLSISYLAKYYQKSKDGKALKITDKALDFISYFIHPDGSSGGEYASRNTEYLLPDGFAILSPVNKIARAIDFKLQKSLDSGSFVGPASLDDKFLLFNGYDYLQAYLDSTSTGSDDGILPYHHEQEKYFENAGLCFSSSRYYYIILNKNKGGNFYINFKTNGDNLRDAGLLLKAKNGNYTSGNLLNNEATIRKEEIIVKSRMVKPFDNRITEFKNIIFRFFQLTFGRFEKISFFVKEFLRKKIIARIKVSNISFTRTLKFNTDGIVVRDVILGAKDIVDIEYSPNLDTIYGECARFFHKWYLSDSKRSIRPNKKEGPVVITREYDRTGKLIKFETD